MSKCLTVKNAVFGRLKANKGNKSYSELLEQIMEKAGIPPLPVVETEAAVVDTRGQHEAIYP